ncbi:hypothetical protein VQZ30_18315 [Microcystis aeruginosa 1339]
MTFIHEPTGAKFAVDRNYC